MYFKNSLPLIIDVHDRQVLLADINANTNKYNFTSFSRSPNQNHDEMLHFCNVLNFLRSLFSLLHPQNIQNEALMLKITQQVLH